MILATVSITAVLGEEGIIKKSKETRDEHANSVIAEEEEMNIVYEQYANAMATEPPEPEIYEDNVLPKKPKLAKGMIPVKYNNELQKWEKAELSEKWYDYENKEWANVVLEDATFNADKTLNENEPYTQLVWIPRYAYKIASMYHTASTVSGDIQLAFIDTYNKDKNGVEYTRDSASEYPTATIGTNTGMSDYIVHPAFDYGGTKLEGFLMGKFESSHTECTTEVSTGQATYTGSEVMTVRANVTSWRNLSTGEVFAICLAMNSEDNVYGLSSNDSIVDPHMTKNSEWGAVAYLSQSAYGKNAEIWNNSNTSYITGMAGSSVDAVSEESTSVYNTVIGMEASTTGNVYGIYDLSGGNWERLASYVNNGHENLINAGDLVSGSMPAKYMDVYSSTVSDGSSAQDENYELVIPTNGKYGDAIYETSSSAGSPWINSWYNDYSDFPDAEVPIFIRGGYNGSDSPAGLFCFDGTAGNASSTDGFRVVIPVLR